MSDDGKTPEQRKNEALNAHEATKPDILGPIRDQLAILFRQRLAEGGAYRAFVTSDDVHAFALPRLPEIAAAFDGGEIADRTFGAVFHHRTWQKVGLQKSRRPNGKAHKIHRWRPRWVPLGGAGSVAEFTAALCDVAIERLGAEAEMLSDDSARIAHLGREWVVRVQPDGPASDTPTASMADWADKPEPDPLGAIKGQSRRRNKS